MNDCLNNPTAERRNEGSEKAGWNREEIMKQKNQLEKKRRLRRESGGKKIRRLGKKIEEKI